MEDLWRKEIAILQSEYEATGNPLCMLDCWQLCRSEDADIPEWVLSHIDRFADTVLSWVHEKPPFGDLDAAVGRAFGFKTGRKDRNRLTEWRLRDEVRRMFIRYEEHWTPTSTAISVLQTIALEFNCSIPTARRRTDHYAAMWGSPSADALCQRRLENMKEAASLNS